MSNNPYVSPQTAGQPPDQPTRRVMPTLLGCLAILGVLVLLGGMLLPARRGAREAARRMSCGNNLKQIGLALHNYYDEHHALPPAYTVDADGMPLHSWRTLILPYMEQGALYEKIDLSKPWDDPANRAAYESTVKNYRCPSVDLPPTHTTYLAVLAPGGCFRPTEPRDVADITDDTDLTLMVIELDAKRAVHWMSPTDATEADVLNLGNVAKLPHRASVMAACASGGVRAISAKSKPEALRALISIAGSDDAIAREAH